MHAHINESLLKEREELEKAVERYLKSGKVITDIGGPKVRKTKVITYRTQQQTWRGEGTGNFKQQKPKDSC